MLRSNCGLDTSLFGLSYGPSSRWLVWSIIGLKSAPMQSNFAQADTVPSPNEQTQSVPGSITSRSFLGWDVSQPAHSCVCSGDEESVFELAAREKIKTVTKERTVTVTVSPILWTFTLELVCLQSGYKADCDSHRECYN
jgi:hypothetical protein